MLWEKLIQLRSQFINIVLPPTCVLCGGRTRRLQNICKPCEQDLPILPHHCQQCGHFLVGDNALVCGACLVNLPPFHRMFALYPYEPPIEQCIVRLKFNHSLKYARFFSELLIKKIEREWYLAQTLPDVIIPVPLHPQRLKERGFNQALEIAKPIGKALHLPVDKFGVQRVKYTAPQSGLNAKERQKNVAKAFMVNKNYQGMTVAVLDDVMTTGNTLREMCSLLKLSGAKLIDVWCCARRG